MARIATEASEDRPTALPDGERWYAVHTMPHSERRAQIQLENQKFRTFLPKRLKTVRHARKSRTVHAPYFARYLFVALDLSKHQWRSVNGTFGVSALVMQGEKPNAVPHGVVEALIAASNERGILNIGQCFEIGQSIRLAVGPLADQLAILDRLDDSGRIRVLLNILGRQVSVSMHSEHALPA
jgi:transcription elongation factor/antiterminator RfaH